ncbi:MAG: hypothetical protein U0800_12895 [Isosphaeraceae bacterium]
MDAALIRRVWKRSEGRCEYGRMAQEFERLRFEIDRVIAFDRAAIQPRRGGGE